MNTQAFFLSPDQRLLRVPVTHITEIINNPEAFGFTSDEIENTYDRYGDRFGYDGKARDEIIKGLLARGWIRIRVYFDYVQIELDNLTDHNKSRLYALMKILLGQAPEWVAPDMTVKIIINKEKVVLALTVQEILADKLYEIHEDKSELPEIEVVELNRAVESARIKQIRILDLL